MRAYSNDLRERVLAAVDQGHPRKEVSERFQVSIATLKRWLQRREREGHYDAKFSPGATPHIGVEEYDALHQQLRTYPDFTLEEHCRHWHQTQGTLLSVAAMCRTIRRSGWTRKKRP